VQDGGSTGRRRLTMEPAAMPMTPGESTWENTPPASFKNLRKFDEFAVSGYDIGRSDR